MLFRSLRESFRLSRAELDRVDERFDWVLNARRSLVFAKLEKPLAEFRRIVAEVGESPSVTGTFSAANREEATR